MLLLIFLLIPNIIAAPTKTIGDYSVTIGDNAVLMNVVSNKRINEGSNKNLDLSSLYMYDIDQRAFDNVTELESLDLSNNNIFTLHSRVFSPLRKLKRLSLANNGLANFREAFVGLENLEFLDISRNGLTQLKKGDFFGIPKSTTIDTSNNRIQTISRALFAEIFTSESAQAILCQDKGIVNSLRHLKKSQALPPGCTRVQIDPGYPHWLRLNRSGIIGFSRNWYHLYDTEIDGLDLCSNNIRDLTREFLDGLPRSLKYIDLSTNMIERVNERSFSTLHQLNYLNLAENRITELKREDFFGLKSLINLHLEGNGLTKISSDCFEHIPTLKKLNLRTNNLINLEYGLFHFIKNIEDLDLSHNSLTSLPPYGFSRLKNLQRLYLNDNSLTSVHRAFIGLSKLVLLDISDNSIKLEENDDFYGPPLTVKIVSYGNFISVAILKERLSQSEADPSVLLCKENKGVVTKVVQTTNEDPSISQECRLIQLVEKLLPTSSEITLNLKGQGITGFHKNWYRLRTKVTKIILDSNYIADVTSEMLNDLPEDVKHVDVRRNSIERLKKGAVANEHLRILNLDNNKIAEVEEDALVNTNLLELGLSHNSLSGTGFVLGLPTSLMHLNASNNWVAGIPDYSFSRLNNLRSLYLDNVFLDNIQPESLRGLTQLNILSLNNNALQSIGRDIFQHTKALEKLYLRRNGLESLDANLFRELTRLTHVDLSANYFSDITKTTLPHFPDSLQSLDLGMNRMRHVEPGSFVGGLKYELLLANNLLETIDKGVFALPNLVVLNLRNNAMNELKGDSFAGMPNLEELYLDGNSITKIDPGAMQYLNKLNMLDLSENVIQELENGAFSGLGNFSDQKFDALIKVDAMQIKHIHGDLFGDNTVLPK